jgi:hypothetical protein
MNEVVSSKAFTERRRDVHLDATQYRMKILFERSRPLTAISLQELATIWPQAND